VIICIGYLKRWLLKIIKTMEKQWNNSERTAKEWILPRWKTPPTKWDMIPIVWDDIPTDIWDDTPVRWDDIPTILWDITPVDWK